MYTPFFNLGFASVDTIGVDVGSGFASVDTIGVDVGRPTGQSPTHRANPWAPQGPPRGPPGRQGGREAGGAGGQGVEGQEGRGILFNQVTNSICYCREAAL